ncbi:pyridine nucleotide-disulfide oxidoreductase, partial [Thermococci archaeon]
MIKTDVLIIGGGAAGIVTALTAKQNYPDKDIIVVRKEKTVLVPCGIPYIFGTLRSVEKDRISDDILTKNGIDILVDEILDIDLKEKMAESKMHGKIAFEKLVLATGSTPLKPPIKGINLKNVFYIYKDAEYLKNLQERIEESEKIVIIGGGFIGIEFADELRKLDKEVAIVEMLPHVLYA